MPTGLALATAQGYLNVLRGVTYTGLPGLWVQLHIGEPGPNGTSNLSAVTTRNQLTLNPPSGSTCTMLSLATWSMTAVETLTGLTIWTLASGGTFVASGDLAVPKPVGIGDTFQMDTLSIVAAPTAS